MNNDLETACVPVEKAPQFRSHARRWSVIVGSLVLQLFGNSAFAAVGAQAFPKLTGNFDNPAVVPLQSSAFGATYPELAARFWQWQFSMPVNASPVFDSADCSVNQSGKIWFLGGSGLAFDVGQGVYEAKTARICSVPTGTALFFPVVTSECSTIPGDQLGAFGPTTGDLRPCTEYASGFIDRSKLVVTVDGVPIRALGQYQVTSPLFTVGPLPANNQLEFSGLVAPAGTTAQAVSNGIHLLLHPLSAGQHTIYFHSEVDLTSLYGVKFVQDITYHLTVGR